MESTTNLILSKSQHDIPNVSETKPSGECYVPGVALSQGLPPSPDPTPQDRNVTEMDGGTNMLIINGK